MKSKSNKESKILSIQQSSEGGLKHVGFENTSFEHNSAQVSTFRFVLGTLVHDIVSFQGCLLSSKECGRGSKESVCFCDDVP